MRDWRPWIVAALFVMFLAPFALTYVTHHPDERHYTNAAIQMLQTGDWLTPYYPDGSARFYKPLMTYWAVGVSYAALGVSQLSSRLPFLLMAAAIVVLTYWLAMLIFRRHSSAWLATWIAASTPILTLSTARSIPDLPLTLFLLVSAGGWIGWLLAERQQRWMPWAAYVGAGLAVASKGLPAVVFLGLSVAFALWNPWRRLSLRTLLHLPSIAVACVVGLGWFVTMYALHGEAALNSFFSDQVGRRVALDFMHIGRQLLMIPVILGLGFLPWIWTARRQLWSGWRAADEGDRAIRLAMGFIVIWALAMAIMAGPVAKLHPRYLLPVIPLLAILLAYLLERLDPVVRLKSMRRLLVVVLVVIFLLFVLAMASSVMLGMDGWALAGGSAAVVATVVLARMGRSPAEGTVVAALGSGMLLLVFTIFLLLRPVLLPDQGTQIAQRLETMGIIDKGVIGYYGSPKVAAKIRVAAAGNIRLDELKSGQSPRGDEIALVLDRDKSGQLDALRYRFVEASQTWRSLPAAALWRAFRDGRMQELKSDYAEVFLIAVPRETPPGKQGL
jgi:4-amino-4-deoxy-L-arabinose transferase-like glycosyltransferase